MLYNAFNFKIADNDKVDVIGLNNKVQAEYVWNLFGVLKKDILIVTNTIYEANLLYKSLSFWSSRDCRSLWPASSCLSAG